MIGKRPLRFLLCALSIGALACNAAPRVLRVVSDAQRQNQTVALQEAVGRDDTNSAYLALQSGADPDGAGPNRTRSEGAPPLCRAAIGGQERMTAVLLQGGADPNIVCGDLTGDGKLDTVLSAAAGTGDDTMVRRLIERGANVNDDPERSGESLALQKAAWRGRGTIVRELLAHGAYPRTHDARGQLLSSALRQAGWVETANDIERAGQQK